jgi:hypothetical protein
MTRALERRGERILLEVYANGGTRSTVCTYELQPDGTPRSLGTDSINLNRAAERAKWAAAFPDALPQPSRDEAVALASELGFEIERERATATSAARKGDRTATTYPAVEPWPDAVDASALLDELCTLIRNYVVLPSHGVATLALWIVHTYVADVADYTPYIHLTSPVRGCGKSTVLQLLEALAFRARRTDSITAAALYRTIEQFSPSLLLDELDTQIKERSESSEHLRGILDSGFQRGGRRTLCVGDENETRDFRTYCPKVLAGIGRLWDTVASRSIPVHMEKASRAELKRVARIRGDRIGAICEPARRKLQRWADDTRAALIDADPDVPEELDGRTADVWRPLLAIADLAGDDWAARARAALQALSGIAGDEGDYGLLLLEDVQVLFSSDAAIEGDKLASATIVEELAKMEDRPWPEFRRDKPITATQLAKLLGRFGIKPRNLRLPAGDIVKGYRYADCQPAFDRYIEKAAPHAATAATTSAAPPSVAAVAATQDGPLGEEEQRELDMERAGMQADA